MSLAPIDTRLGTFGAEFSERGLTRLTFPAEVSGPLDGRQELSVTLVEQLNAYLEGRLRTFTVPLDLRGTAFQLGVWRAVLKIPYGSTRSYAEVAAGLGRAGAVRAVGAANGSNPIPILVPCHRVIGSSGRLTGYGGGLDLKLSLLRLEGALLA